MQLFLLTFVICIAALKFSLCEATPPPSNKTTQSQNLVTRETRAGFVVGRVVKTTNGLAEQYLGIPYAKAPVGNLRWRPPQPLEEMKRKEKQQSDSRSGRKNRLRHPRKHINGLEFTSPCSQPPLLSFWRAGSPSEDCLHLNIWRPHSSKRNLPVFMSIHGGGLSLGTAMSPLFDFGRFSSRGDVITVSINYRLGVMAYMLDESLVESDGTNGGANGILDMIEALRWIQQNIEFFGGNPNQVTIGGESGGGNAVCFLMVSPAARGLYHRAIQQSGSCMHNFLGSNLGEQEGISRSARILARFNVSTIDELRSVDAQIIANSFAFGAFYPFVDGLVFPKNITLTEMYQNGDEYFIPQGVMLGTTFDDSVWRGAAGGPPSFPRQPSEFLTYLRLYMPQEEAVKIANAYPIAGNALDPTSPSVLGSQTAFTWSQMTTDLGVRCPTLRQVEYLSKSVSTPRSKVYFYQFGGPREPWDTLSHASELPYVYDFDPKANVPFVPRADVLLTDVMSNLWIEFIASDPLGFRDTVWDPAISENGGDGKFLLVFGLPRNANMSEIDFIRQRCPVFDDISANTRLSFQFLILGNLSPSSSTSSP